MRLIREQLRRLWFVNAILVALTGVISIVNASEPSQLDFGNHVQVASICGFAIVGQRDLKCRTGEAIPESMPDCLDHLIKQCGVSDYALVVDKELGKSRLIVLTSYDVAVHNSKESAASGADVTLANLNTTPPDRVHMAQRELYELSRNDPHHKDLSGASNQAKWLKHATDSTEYEKLNLDDFAFVGLNDVSNGDLRTLHADQLDSFRRRKSTKPRVRGPLKSERVFALEGTPYFDIDEMHINQSDRYRELGSKTL